jgi:hypothetical protein
LTEATWWVFSLPKNFHVLTWILKNSLNSIVVGFIQRHASKQPQRLSPKIQKIIDIWNSGSGVVCLQIFQNSIAVEALTREAAMIDAIGNKRES